MLAKTFGSALQGVEALTVTIEVNSGPGMKLAMVGLAEKSVQESIDRIKSAIRHNKYNWPRGRLVINMAPADVRKIGSGFDLGLALGILAASKQLSPELLPFYMIMGEMSLDGSLQPIKGALPIAMHARKSGFKGILLPARNAPEAAIVNQLAVIPIAHLNEAVDFLNGKGGLEPVIHDTRAIFSESQGKSNEDFSEVKGQREAKWALEIAAAGGHNLMLIGPPGSGKTMLAKRLRTILPPMSLHEALETTKIHSVAGQLGTDASLLSHRPFRSPHQTISNVAMVGGGSYPQPGEISLAHNGVLYLDELPEFKRQVLEVLRQPLEEHKVIVSRARQTITYPSNFMLVASLNPCPCGNFTHPNRSCSCTPLQIRKYLGKISGPLMDRIDIQIIVPPLSYDKLTSDSDCESSKDIRGRVLEARARQVERFKRETSIHSNAMMSPALVRRYCKICPESAQILKGAITKLGLSARAYDRVVRVARTIADLGSSDEIQPDHVAEAVSYRNLDRENWAG